MNVLKQSAMFKTLKPPIHPDRNNFKTQKPPMSWSIPPTLISRLKSNAARNDFDKLGGNYCLTGTVIDDLQCCNHVTGVLGRSVHRRHTGTLFGASRFFHSVENEIRKRELVEVLEHRLIYIVILQHSFSR